MGKPQRDGARKQKIIKQRMARRVELIVMMLLILVSLAHLLRLISGAELMIGGTLIPLWISLFGFIGPAVLAGLFWWSRH